MTLAEIARAVEAEILVAGPAGGPAIECGFCADLMSDVLAFCPPEALLITGLTNAQVVRTAEVADIRAVIFIQAKKPDHETVVLAAQKHLPLLSTALSGFEVCARLHGAGLCAARAE